MKLSTTRSNINYFNNSTNIIPYSEINPRLKQQEH